jgi:hypothetical protein
MLKLIVVEQTLMTPIKQGKVNESHHLSGLCVV